MKTNGSNTYSKIKKEEEEENLSSNYVRNAVTTTSEGPLNCNGK